MTLAQFRKLHKAEAKQSKINTLKNEVLELLQDGYSHKQCLFFLQQNSILVSQSTFSAWVKTQKSTKPKTQIPSTPFLPKQERKEENISTIVQSPRVEPTEAPKNFDLSNDPKYARIWQVAQERTKMREEALQEKYNENHDSQY